MLQLSKSSIYSTKPGYIFQNDIVALKQAFSLPDIDYADISQREQLAAALKRWPLLAEFAQQK
ncbi:cellulose biosynthesis protein BcsR [Escherichia coli]|uniref:cellulose biosynthesis protein BcsR n=1 Tax=Escherichia coli TaxID=562 RepID=UPI00201FAC06|nr:cellulose biosynthesis protein BcsR [Escherichia coli]